MSGVTHYIEYIYDANSVIGMIYHNTTMAVSAFEYYFFEKNLQGDIVAVYNATGTKLVAYTYDAWGNVTTTYYNGGASTAAQYNGFRYRGYYYDSETGLYYLNSRYYDPATGRFINADGYISTGQGLAGFNMYSYCNNNPILYVDGTGNLPIVENDDTYYPEAFCEYLNAFGYKKLEQNVAAFNAETISEYMNGAGNGLSYADYEALKCWSITTEKPMWAYGRSNDSLDEIIFSSFCSTLYSIENTFHHSTTMNYLQGAGAGLYAYGVMKGMVDSCASDTVHYYGDPSSMYTAMGISCFSSAIQAFTLPLDPISSTIVCSVIECAELVAKIYIIGY